MVFLFWKKKKKAEQKFYPASIFQNKIMRLQAGWSSQVNDFCDGTTRYLVGINCITVT